MMCFAQIVAGIAAGTIIDAGRERREPKVGQGR